MPAEKGGGAGVTADDGRTAVRIRYKHTLRKRANLKSASSIPVNGGCGKEVVPVRLPFFCRCAKAGALCVEFPDVGKAGSSNSNSLERRMDWECLTVTPSTRAAASGTAQAIPCSRSQVASVNMIMKPADTGLPAVLR